MKRILKAFFIATIVLLFGAVQNKTSAQVSVRVSFQSFYDELSPYGDWMSYPEYGYVWRPDNRYRDFQPYSSDGHWAWSEDGWLWVSDYEWGWAPFHYGRWIYDSYEGWLWVPDYEWAPAWVVWRGGGDYYGWAPMSPGISINLYLGNRYNIPYNYWCFAPSRYITSPHLSRYYLDRGRNTTIINHTTIINNYDRNSGYVIGPSRHDVERYTGSTITPVRIRETQRAGRTIARNDEISIYKPYINRGIDRGAPRTFENSTRRSQSVITDRNTTRQERPYQNRGNQQIERQQFPDQNNTRVERQSVPDQNNRRVERPYQNRGNQQIERQQLPDQNTRQIERRQFPNQNDQRVESQQIPGQNTRRMERPYQNRGNQQMERQQFPNQNSQQVERQQIFNQNNQRMERQQMPNQNSQRMERPYQSRGQQPQVQNQSTQEQRGNGNGNGNGHGRGRGRGN